jgi:hypothetical protein
MNSYVQCQLLLALLLLGSSHVLAAQPSGETKAFLWSGEFEENWTTKWHVREKHSWGLNNLQVVSEPDSSKFTKILRVTYPKESASFTAAKHYGTPIGGAQFEADPGLSPRDCLHLRYYVCFADDFPFVKGGKLPGLFGGEARAGGQIPDGTNGFSTRLMWRRNGDGEVYAYLPTGVERGTSLGRGNWRFQQGKWYLVEQAVQLNTPGRSNGSIRLWINEDLVVNDHSLTFRTTPELKIEGILFSTFFGGKDLSWATPQATHVDFAHFAVSDRYIGP